MTPLHARRLRKRHPTAGAFSLPLVALLLLSCMRPDVSALRERELREARAAFDANLDAIKRRDLDGYLAGYLQSPDFLFIGPDGPSRGFADFAAARQATPDFPDSLAAGTPELTWLAPGVVHVVYPYAARQGNVVGAGWSERVLVHTAEGWKIAMTGVIPGR
jgi:hypothetical protein